MELQNRHFAQAKQWAEQAITMDPTNLYGHWNAGKAAIKLGETQLARSHLERARELCQNNRPDYQRDQQLAKLDRLVRSLL